MTTIRTYSELITLPTFEERLQYLYIGGKIGAATFGADRIFNQRFYTSKEWRNIKNYIITRDNGHNLAMPGDEYIISDGMSIYVHHMNPIDMNDISNGSEFLLNPEYLISVTKDVHDYIHYGIKHERSSLVERRPNDMCPWKK